MQNAPLLIDASPFLIDASPWVILAVYCVATWLSTPRAVAAPRFFDGKSASGKEPGILLVAFSAAITWAVVIHKTCFKVFSHDNLPQQLYTV